LPALRSYAALQFAEQPIGQSVVQEEPPEESWLAAVEGKLKPPTTRKLSGHSSARVTLGAATKAIADARKRMK
jgi:hypothetical protein